MYKWKVFYRKAGQEAPFLLVEADTSQRATAAAYCALDGIEVYRVVPYESYLTSGSSPSSVSVTIGLDTSEATQKIGDLQAQANTLLATLKECGKACEGCSRSGLLVRASDLAAVIREHDYRTERTE